MQSKEPGSQCRRPHLSRHTCEDKKEEHRVKNMPEEVLTMVHLCIQREPFAIEHMWNPSHRMPVGGLAVQLAKCPFHSFPGEAFLDDSVLVHIVRIIIINKVAIYDATEGSQSKDTEG